MVEGPRTVAAAESEVTVGPVESATDGSEFERLDVRIPESERLEIERPEAERLKVEAKGNSVS